MKQQLTAAVAASVLLVAGLLVGVYFLLWSSINWGSLHLLRAKTLTVSGSATSEVKNKVAVFYAGISASNDDKNVAINQVNEQMKRTLDRLKSFGIKEKDIKTSNISIYQEKDYYHDEQDPRKSRSGQWQVSNNISVKLRDVKRASELYDTLIKSGLTNVSGPSFSLENTNTDGELIAKAIEDAKEKAKEIAQSEGLKLGDILNVSEGRLANNGYGYRGFSSVAIEEDGGGVPVEPGATKVEASVVVVFELK